MGVEKMKLSEAIKALEDGKKVRKNYWYKGDHLWMKDSDSLEWEDGQKYELSNYDFIEEWEIYNEPKRKIKRWLWAWKNRDLWDLCAQFRSEEEVRGYFNCPVIKLPWSETEFDE